MSRFFFLLFLFNYPLIATSWPVLTGPGGFPVGLRLLVSAFHNIAIWSLAIYLVSLLPRVLSRFILQFLFSFLWAFTLLSLLHFSQYSQLIGLPSIHAVIDTTWNEAAEFVLTSLKSIDMLHGSAAILISIPMMIAVFRPPPLPAWRRRMRLSSASMFVGILALIGLGYLGFVRPYLWKNNPVLMLVGSTVEVVLETREVKRLLENNAGHMPNDVRVTSNKPATHILILGESTTSRHMSLYGYTRDTTPELRKLVPELELAANACSSRGNTPEQLKELMTFASRENPELLTTGPSLTQLMKAGGFQISWLSNQQILGEWDRWAGIFSTPADMRRIVNLRGWDEGVSYDEKLLPHLREILADKSQQRRFIVIHLLGAHHGYDLRYPPEFEKFEGLTGADERFIRRGYGRWKVHLYNSYDNAVLYNDYVVSEIIREAKKVERVTVTYLSDHGEALGETSSFFGHLEGHRLRQIYEIPLLFYLSPALKQEYGVALDAMRTNLTRPVQSDQLIHTFLDLYGIDHRLKRPEGSLMSMSFQPKPRFCDTLDP